MVEAQCILSRSNAWLERDADQLAGDVGWENVEVGAGGQVTLRCPVELCLAVIEQEKPRDDGQTDYTLGSWRAARLACKNSKES